jgi:hypothetical protein
MGRDNSTVSDEDTAMVQILLDLIVSVEKQDCCVMGKYIKRKALWAEIRIDKKQYTTVFAGKQHHIFPGSAFQNNQFA